MSSEDKDRKRYLVIGFNENLQILIWVWTKWEGSTSANLCKVKIEELDNFMMLVWEKICFHLRSEIISEANKKGLLVVLTSKEMIK